MSVRATIVLGQLLHMVSKMVNLSNYVLSTFHLVVKIKDPHPEVIFDPLTDIHHQNRGVLELTAR